MPAAVPGRPSWAPLGAALLAAILALACGEDGGGGGGDGRLTATMTSVSAQAGYAPLEVRFEGDYEAAEDVDDADVQLTWDFGDGGFAEGPSVPHIYQDVGVFTVSLTAREVVGGETRSEDSVETTITIYPDAELRVGLPIFGPAAVNSSQDLRVTYDLFSEAAEIPIPFQVTTYLAEPGVMNSNAPPDPDTLDALVLQGRVHAIDTVEIESFGGTPTQENFDNDEIRIPATVPSGTYQVVVYADDTGVIGEFDEQDNVAFSTTNLTFVNTSTEGPDLRVASVQARPSRTNLLTTLTVDFTVANDGNQTALGFDYEIFLSFTNDTFEQSDRSIATGRIDGVGAGATATVDDLVIGIDPPEAALGSYFVIVVADTGDDVTEAAENNNTRASNAIIVTDEPIPGTDLLPTSFTFTPTTSFLDGSVRITASVINQGSEVTPRQFFCRVYLSDDAILDTTDPLNGDQQLDTLNFPALGAGVEEEVTKVSRIPGFFDPGLYNLFITCDPNSQIPEADEDNNVLQAEGRLEIATDPEIDVRIGTFDIQPRTVDNEADVTISMSICNDGSNGAGPSIVRVIISADSALDLTDTVLLQSTVDSVEAGECTTIEETVPAICDTFQPTYNVFAVLDATNLLPEVNETNNEISLDSPLSIEGAICQCVDDPLERNANGTNNSPATPTFVSPRTYEALTTCDLALEWYAIPLVQGETVRAITTFDNDRGNLDLTLYAADRATILDTSTSNGDREEVIAFVVPETGDYLLKVAGRTPSDVNVYDMTIEVTPPLSGTDLIVTAVTLSNTRPVLAEAVDISFDLINLGDVAAGQSTARIYISDDVEVDPATDELLGQVVITDVPAVGKRQRTVSVNMPGEGPGGGRYIAVIADALNEVSGELDETNNASFSDLFELDAGCFDPLEPNNVLEDPYPVTLSGEVTTLSGLLVCTENRDFYEICGDAGDFLRMMTRFDGELYDVDMRLYAQGGVLLERAEGTSGEEVIQVDYLSADQCYTLEVIVIGADREAPYELIVESGDAPPELVCSGVGEPNDAFGTAAPIGEHLENEVAVCPVSDIDYFFLNVTAGTSLQLRFLPPVGESTVPSALRMSLWGPTRNFLTNTVSATEPLIYTTVSSGRHYLRVTSLASGPRNQEYRLEVIGLDGRDLQPLDLLIDPQVAALGERVQYTFTITNNRTLASGAFSYGVYLSDDPIIDPDDDLLLRSEDEGSLAGAGTREVGNKVTIPADAGLQAGALHFLGVFVDHEDVVDEFEEGNNVALLLLQILAECPADGAEPNDVRADWADLDDFLGVDLQLCEDDSDWYRATVTGNTSYVLTSTVISGEGDLDLFVWDAANNLLGSAETLSSDETVEFTSPVGATTVYIQVEPFGLTGLTYHLDLAD